MTKQQILLNVRTNEELLIDWEVLDAVTETKITVEQSMVRGWLMDEIEKRFPTEFDNWIENCADDDNIRKYIVLA